MSVFWVNWQKVVAIEKGEWNNYYQDHKAILVMEAGARVPWKGYCRDAYRRMIKNRAAAMETYQ